MVEQNGGGMDGCWPPAEAPAALLNAREEEHWRHFDNSVNAVSFGFVATAVLISMFLVMAIFERFLRPATSGRSHNADLEMGFKLAHPSPKTHHWYILAFILNGTDTFTARYGDCRWPETWSLCGQMTVYANGVSVLMPGDNIPTFIAHPAPVPCPSEPNTSSSSNSIQEN